MFQRTSPRAASFRRVLIEGLETRLFLAADFALVGAKLSTGLSAIQAKASTAIDPTAKLPLLNVPLTSISATKHLIDSVRTPLANAVSGISTQTQAAIRDAVYGVVGPTALNLVKDTNASGGVDADDVKVTLSGDNFNVVLSLQETAGTAGAPVTPGTGLASVPLAVNTGTSKVTPTVTGGFDNLQFGWADGKAYFGVNSPVHIKGAGGGTLRLNVSASLGAGSLGGTLGYFPVTSTIAADDPSTLTANFAASFGVDGSLGATTLSGSSHIDWSFTSSASNPSSLGVPTVKVRYVQDQDFGTGSSPNGSTLGTTANKPAVAMKVQVGVRSTVDNLLAPFGRNLETLVKPVEPIIDVLTTPLPVISDLSNAVGAGEVTLLSVIKAGVAYSTNGDPDALAAIDQIKAMFDGARSAVDKVKALQSIGSLPDVFLNVGEFNLSGNGDLRTLPAASTNYAKQQLDTLTPFHVNDAGDYRTSVISQLNSAGATSLVNFLNSGLSGGGSKVNYAVGLPVFESRDALYNLLLGRNADLATFNYNGGSYNVKAPIGEFRAGPIKVAFGANFNATFKLHMGVDGNGLRTLDRTNTSTDLFQGLYVGSDTNFSVGGGLTVSAGPDIVVFSLSLVGGVGLTFSITPNTDHQKANEYLSGINGTDDDADRVRPNELGGVLFHVGGAITGSLGINVRIGVKVPFVGFVGYEDTYNIASGTIFSFDIANIPDPFLPPPVLNLATRLDNGTLRLAAGPFSGDLSPASLLTDSDSESFGIVADPNDATKVIVSGYGYTQSFSNITAISAAGTTKPLNVTVGEGVNVPVLLIGGSGDDHFTVYGNGNAILDGEGGADQITYGGSGDVTITGAGGPDQLTGGSGRNEIDGGGDNDVINVGNYVPAAGVNSDAEGDTLPGNLVDGEAGDDTIVGGLGRSNTLYGGGGNDNITAGDKNDLIYGDEPPERRDVTLHGTAGNDTVTAGAGVDTVYGGAGDDQFNWNGQTDGNAGFAGEGGYNSVVAFGTDGADVIDTVEADLPGGSGTAGAVRIGGTRGVVFQDVTSLDIEGGGGADNIHVRSTSHLGLTSVGVNLQDVFKKDNAADTVRIDGANGVDNVAISNEGVAVHETPVFTNGRPDGSTFEFGGITRFDSISGYVLRVGNVQDAVRLSTFTGNDAITVYGISGVTQIDAGADDDAIKVQADSPTVPVPADPETPPSDGQKAGPRFPVALAIDAGSGASNSFNFTDLTPAGAIVQLAGTTDGSITANSTAVPHGVFVGATGGGFAGGVAVQTGNGKDNVRVFSTIAEAPTSVKTGGNDDAIVVADQAVENTNAIRNRLRLDGQAGNNTITLDNNSITAGDTQVIVRDTQVANFAGGGTQIVDYASTGGLTTLRLIGSNNSALAERFLVEDPTGFLVLDLRSGNDYVAFEALDYNATVSGGAGNDTVVLGKLKISGNTTGRVLEDLFGVVTFDGGSGTDSITVDDSLALSANHFYLYDSYLTYDFGVVKYTNTESVSIKGGQGNDDLYVRKALPAATPISFSAGAGTANRVTGADLRSGWQLNGGNTGRLNDVLTFDHVQKVTGGTAYDNFAVANGAQTNIAVDGRGGFDSLDYTAWTTAVVADLTSGTATGLTSVATVANLAGGLGNDLLRGDGNRNTLNGNGGNDILLGLGDADSLIGGYGSDILIAGSGADVLNGQAGNDLLVDGTTAYDASNADLFALRNQLTGASGPIRTFPPLLSGTNKLFHDAFSDRLTGGPDADYFFAQKAGRGIDLLTDVASIDTLRN